jgi:hypothetical protein
VVDAGKGAANVAPAIGGAATDMAKGIAGAVAGAIDSIDTRPYLTRAPEQPEPTGQSAEIAKKQGMVWRQLQDGRHGWIPKDRMNSRVGTQVSPHPTPSTKTWDNVRVGDYYYDSERRLRRRVK